ncbi:MAG: hypothetical protein KZQ77_06330 [Candidatus Thiodiazotropha sp. (ex Notomyrtea botanica)]|nr:hypothetical protein [Candidatus Thiodiazotropha sp. (ex Notomyrtea botanica)]
MDISSIPKTFWHALSLSVLLATGGLVYIAYQSSTVSIEIANAKIQLSSAITETKEIKSDLEVENERLRQAAEELKTKIRLLENLVSSGSPPSVTTETLRKLKPLGGENAEIRTLIIQPDRFKEFDSRIEQAQQYLK